MSDVILLGVLRMPDELFWREDPLTRVQHNSRRFEAADELEKRADLIQHLEQQLSMHRNKSDLLAEDIECVHKCLDDEGIPRFDEKNQQMEFSIWGRICRLKEKIYKIGSDAESAALTSKPANKG